MNQLSFGISTTADFFKKLLEDYEDFKNNPTSAKTALNCAMTAWHLSDWVYHEFNTSIAPRFEKLTLYQQDLKAKCPSLQIMHDLTNGTKHYHLDRHKPQIKGTKLHQGAFSQEFSREFDVSYLDVEMNDGTHVDFEDEIEHAVEFWRTYLDTNFGLRL